MEQSGNGGTVVGGAGKLVAPMGFLCLFTTRAGAVTAEGN